MFVIFSRIYEMWLNISSNTEVEELDALSQRETLTGAKLKHIYFTQKSVRLHAQLNRAMLNI